MTKASISDILFLGVYICIYCLLWSSILGETENITERPRRSNVRKRQKKKRRNRKNKKKKNKNKKKTRTKKIKKRRKKKRSSKFCLMEKYLIFSDKVKLKYSIDKTERERPPLH